MGTKFVIKKRLVGDGPRVEFAVYEDLGWPAGLTWQPWFVSRDEEEANRYAHEANQMAKRSHSIRLASPYWCEVSPRSGCFGPQFNIYQSEGFFGFGKKLVHSTHTQAAAETWSNNAARLLKSI